jgi:uncharacterized protein
MENVRIITTVSKNGRRILGRLLPSTDLIMGIKAMCRQVNLDCGIIVSVIGSLKMAEFHYAVPDESQRLGIRMQSIRIRGPLELLSCQGVIGLTEERDLSIHLHGVVSDDEMKLYGGHFLPDSSPILGTGEIIIQESSDVQIILKQDEETGRAVHKYYSLINR